jgi:hypothetical protein
VAEANQRIANSLTLLVGMVRMQASAAGRRDDPVSAAELRLALPATGMSGGKLS